MTKQNDEANTMCNDYGNRVPYSAYVEEFSHIRLPLRFPSAAPNLEPRDDIWPTEVAPIIRRHGDGVELAATALGPRARPPEGAADHQLPLRRPQVLERPLSRAGVTLLRVYGQEVAQDEMEVHEDRGGLVLLCGSLAPRHE
jgi:hypothetical protein